MSLPVSSEVTVNHLCQFTFAFPLKKQDGHAFVFLKAVLASLSFSFSFLEHC